MEQQINSTQADLGNIKPLCEAEHSCTSTSATPSALRALFLEQECTAKMNIPACTLPLPYKPINLAPARASGNW